MENVHCGIVNSSSYRGRPVTIITLSIYRSISDRKTIYFWVSTYRLYIYFNFFLLKWTMFSCVSCVYCKWCVIWNMVNNVFKWRIQVSRGLVHVWGTDGAWDWQMQRLQWCGRCIGLLWSWVGRQSSRCCSIFAFTVISICDTVLLHLLLKPAHC